MKTFARITAVLLIIFGILIVLAVIALGLIGAFREVLRLTGTLPPAHGAGLAGLVSLLFFLGYGLLVTGMGQGLYLLAGIASRSHAS